MCVPLDLWVPRVLEVLDPCTELVFVLDALNAAPVPASALDGDHVLHLEHLLVGPRCGGSRDLSGRCFLVFVAVL